MLIFGASALSLGCEDVTNRAGREEPGTVQDERGPGVQQDRSGPGSDLSDERTRGEGAGEQGRTEGSNPPFQQTENADDLRLTAAVRRAVLDAENLGAGADNAIITTNAGVVTLRGQVASEAEKSKVEEIARGVEGVVRVDNQLQVGAGAPKEAYDAGKDLEDRDEGDQTPPATTPPAPR
jgi:hyperosmotically inducible protein